MSQNRRGLPPRPTAGSGAPTRNQPQSYTNPAASMNYVQPSYNLSGGYGGYQAQAPAFNPAYGYPAMPAHPQYPSYPYAAYGSYPAMPNPYQTFGQSLFQQPQQTIPHYPQMPIIQPADPSAKRQKMDHEISGSGDPMSWRNCSMDGCKFVGSGDMVNQHEEDRHLIFRNGPKVELSEEEQRYANHKGPAPPVFGTSITLHTEEEIAKWVAERRAKWPGAKRVAEKKEERAQAFARGENPDAKGKRDKRTRDPASMAEDWGRTETAPTQSDRGGRGRGRERGRGSERGRGRGDREGGNSGRGGRGGFEAGRSDNVSERGGRGRGRGRGGAASGRTQDSGYPGTAVPAASALPPVDEAHRIVPPPDTPKTQSSVPGIAGLGEYESSDSTSDSSTSSDSSDTSSSSASVDEDDANLAAETHQVVVESEPEKEKEVVPQVCQYWAKNGRCRTQDRCPNAHPAEMKAPSHPMEPPRKLPRQPPQKKPNTFARPSLLGQLLANPIQNTLSQLTQTIRFLVANDMLRNVELIPGQAEEEEKKRNLVSVIEPAVETDSVPPDTSV